eukprot:jgi/Picsp_1/3361/NSC_06199-R1_---NA---
MADEGNVHCDGGFSGYYGIDRDDGSFVHRIAEDGKEDMGPSARERKRWAVYEVSDKARQLKDTTRGTGEEEATEIELVVDPERVIGELIEAKAELDVVVDLVNMVEQQQFFGLTHVPRTGQQVSSQADFERKVSVVSGLEKIRQTSSRLSKGVERLRGKETRRERFLEEVGKLREQWRVLEYRGAGGRLDSNSFTIDISFNMEGGSDEKRILGNYIFVISPDEEGHACALLVDEQNADETVVNGWLAIGQALKRLQRIRAWRYIHKKLVEEIEFNELGGSDSDAIGQRALMYMSSAALAAADPSQKIHHQGFAYSEDKIDMDDYRSRVQRDLLNGNDVAFFVSHFSRCQCLFEHNALVILASEMEWARVPQLVRMTTPSKPPSLLSKLITWLRNASLCYTIAYIVSGKEVESSPLVQHIAREDAQTLLSLGDNGRGIKIILRESANQSIVGELVAQGETFSWQNGKILQNYMNKTLGRVQVQTIMEQLSGASILVEFSSF